MGWKGRKLHDNIEHRLKITKYNENTNPNGLHYNSNQKLTKRLKKTNHPHHMNHRKANIQIFTLYTLSSPLPWFLASQQMIH